MPTKPDSATPEYLILGEILRPHGIRGELRMRILTAYPEHLSELENVYLGRDPMKANAVSYSVEHIRMHQAYGLLKLKGIDDRDQADRLRTLYVMANLEDAIPLEDDEIYLYELIGMTVKTDDGKTLGTISEVMETGANEVYIIDSPQYGEILIPVTDETLLKIDSDTDIVTVKLPEGLLPHSSEDA
jgi:16S rRNA processing protein RimM